MTRNIPALFAAGLFFLGTAMAVAEEGHEAHGAAAEAPAKGMGHGSMGHMGMDMGKSGMTHGDAMHEMHAQMQALRDHSKMMEGMTDQQQLSEEMKKHMRMMDEMMEKMEQCHMQSASGEEPKP